MTTIRNTQVILDEDLASLYGVKPIRLREQVKRNSEKFPNKKTPFFAKELNRSVKNIERWIKELEADKKIEFIGTPKTGGYRVVDDGKDK